MNGLTLWIHDEFLLWGVNVLLEVTVVTAIVLSLCVSMRRQPAIRYGILCTGLLLALLTPFIAATMQFSGQGLLSASVALTRLGPEPVANGASLDDGPAIERVSPMSAETQMSGYPALPALPKSSSAADSDVWTKTKSDSESRNVGELNAPGAAPGRTAAAVVGRPENIGSRISAFALTGLRFLLDVGMPPLLAAWWVGAVLLLVRLMIGWNRLAEILRLARANADETLGKGFAAASTVFWHVHSTAANRSPSPFGSTKGLFRSISAPEVELVVSDRISGPVVAGLRRPRIVFPERLIGVLSPEEARNIFLHELAHVVRRDQIIVLLQNLLAALFWLHPLIRILNRQLAQAREEVCDNYVLVATDAPSYSRTLLRLVQLIQPARPLPGTVGFFTSQWKFERRIADLLDQRRNRMTCLSVRGRALVVSISLTTLFLALLGTLTPAVGQPPKISTTSRSSSNLPVLANADVDRSTNAAADPPSRAAAPEAEKSASVTQSVVEGRVTHGNAEPVAGASVLLVASRITGDRGAVQETLAEGVTDAAGRYILTFLGASSKTHVSPILVICGEALALAWKQIDLDLAKSHIDMHLDPQQLIQVRLIDIEGQPAANVDLAWVGISPRKGDAAPQPGLWLRDQNPRPRTIMPRLKSDEHGLLTVPNVSPAHGVDLAVLGTERFAPQCLALNTGAPESRPENDGTYRALVKNFPVGDVVILPLAPAQIFEGVVFLGDSDRPAGDARITMWASQQPVSGSMIGIEGKTDSQGRFRLNPYAGVRFGINAYPPEGLPYQVRQLRDLKWDSGESSKTIEIRLPVGVLAEGTVFDAESGKPLPRASIQYHPERKNKHLTSDILTGWQSIQQTDEQGQFKIAVLPGPGTLLIHAPIGTSYILAEKGSRELEVGQPGGTRHYAHAFEKINPPEPASDSSAAESRVADSKPIENLKIKLRPGGAVIANLVDSLGQPIEYAISTSRLKIHPTNPAWRADYVDEMTGGRAEIHGLERGKKYSVLFLDRKRNLGAAALISLSDPRPTIELRPCGSAKARFVDRAGKPVRSGVSLDLQMVVTPGRSAYSDNVLTLWMPAADEDYETNFDANRVTRSPVTDDNGEVIYPTLVPGATYRYFNHARAAVEKTFVAESGKQHDMGNITVDVGD